MAADYQHQLAGKSNEFAHHKTLFDKTRSDLVQLRASVEELREERHRFANEAMRVVALELRLQRMTEERDRLACEVRDLRRMRSIEGEIRITELVAEVAALTKDLAISRADAPVTYITDEEASGRKPHQEFIRMSYGR